MNRLIIALIIIFSSSFPFLAVNFLRNYNSPESIEKRCISKFEKDFDIPSGISLEEWYLILDLADNNYLKCMAINQY